MSEQKPSLSFFVYSIQSKVFFLQKKSFKKGGGQEDWTKKEKKAL